MFIAKMQEYTLHKPRVVVDDYNYEKLEYELAGTVSAHLVTNAITTYSSNDLKLGQVTLTGYTQDIVEINDVIAGKYKVVSVLPHKFMYYLSLLEIDTLTYE